MSVDLLLSRLNKVRSTGRGSWTACCPAHGDKTPSLAITQKEDGLILIHDFGGCSVEKVLDAVQLDMNDLFPQRMHEMSALYPQAKPASFRFSPLTALQAINGEAQIVVIAARLLIDGKTLSEQDMARLVEASGRISDALEVVGIE